MWTEREKELIQKYAEEIRHQYNQWSRVPFLAKTRKETNTDAPDFLKIERRFRIPRDAFEENHLLVVRPFAETIELSEYQYIIDVLKNLPTIPLQASIIPSKEMLDNAINELLNTTVPDYIIIPLAFMVDLSMASLRLKFPFIEYKDGNEYYTYEGKRLHILWSNKFITLNEIIIGCSKDSIWFFKAVDDDERLNVRFDLPNHELNPVLLIQTIFRFCPPPDAMIRVIKFPKSICEPWFSSH
jgi:hypothetical protein